MQINGSPLSNLYISRPSGLDDKVREPVVIDVNSFKVEDSEEQQSTVIDSAVSQQAISFNDAQQSRFIREFTISDEPSSSDSSQTVKAQSLPQGVQQYLQVERLPTEDVHQLLDETV